MALRIRKAEALDEARWRELFDAYNRFYEREPEPAITAHTWARIQDFGSPVHAIVAESGAGQVIAIVNYVVHESTTAKEPVCYLQDLFVDPPHRGAGVGRQLIDWMLEEMKRQGWSRVYWNTKEDNYRARALYDSYTPHSGFVRYVVKAR